MWKKQLKTVGYLLVTVALLFSCLGLYTLRADRDASAAVIEHFDAAELSALPMQGYQAELKNDVLHVTMTEADPNIQLPNITSAFDLVIVNFADTYTGIERPMVYFSTGEPFREDMSRTPFYGADGKEMQFSFSSFPSGAVLRLDLDGNFSLESIEIINTALFDIRSEFNLNALLVLAGALLVLFLVEKWFGYYGWLKQKLKGEAERCNSLLRDGKKGFFLLHLASLLVTFATLCTVGWLLTIDHFTQASLLTVFLLTVLSVVLQLCDRILSDRGADAAKLFLICSLLIGLMMVYSMPPASYVAWDDETHFGRSFDFVHLFDKTETLAEQFIFVHKAFPVEDYLKDPTAYVNSITRFEVFDVVGSSTMHHPYNAVSYLPMMLTQILMLLVGANLTKVVLLCRIANLLTYAFVVYFGLRKLKNGACIIASVCMLPTAFFLACSCNYDFWLTAWLIYAFSIVLSVLQDESRHFEVLDMVKLFTACVLACAPKALYVFMMVPLLFVGKKHFATPKMAKRFRIATLITAGLILATLVLPGLLVPDIYTDNRGGSTVSSGGQISFILENPFRYAGILFKFLASYCSVLHMNNSVTMYAYLGNAGVFFGTVSVFVLFYSIFTDRHKEDGYCQLQPARWLTLLTCVAQMVLVATSLYVGFTPVGHETILGCQYRYIFPILIPFCYFLAPKGIDARVNPKLQKALVFGLLCANLLASFYQVYLGTMVV